MDEDVKGKVYDRRLIARMLGYLKPFLGSVAGAVGLLIVQSVLDVIGPLLTKLVVDRYLVPAKLDTWFEAWLNTWLSGDARTGVLQVSAIFLASVVLRFFAEFGQTWIMQRTGQLAMFNVRRDLMAKLQGIDVATYDTTPVGRLMTRVTTDVDVLNELFSSGLVTIIGDFLLLSLVIISMLRLSPGMTSALLIVLPFVVLVTARFRSESQGSYRKTRSAVARINSFLQEHVSGMSVVQLFNRESKARDSFERVNREHMDAFKESIHAYGWFYPVVEFLGMLSLAMLLAYGGYRVQDGALSLGVLVAFFQYGLRFFRPIQDLSEKYNILQSALAAAERVFQLLDTPVNITNPPAAKSLPQGPLAIEFDQVWFAYKGEEWVLQDVSFRIEPGQTFAVVGHTGAGKTTLTNLILRFYDVQRGTIRLGGVDIREVELAELRSRFAIVLQDPYLFTGTIASNIRLGTEEIDDNRVRNAAERVNLAEFVQSLPSGFEQAVRERGAGYSTGQKQLVSFARALAHDPQCLILDEATSSIDTATEQKIRQALNFLLEGRTSLVIAHRLSTIQRADCILVMHKGQLREKGTHAELLAVRGLYWKLYQLQYKNQEVLAQAPGTALIAPEKTEAESRTTR